MMGNPQESPRRACRARAAVRGEEGPSGGSDFPGLMGDDASVKLQYYYYYKKKVPVPREPSTNL